MRVGEMMQTPAVVCRPTATIREAAQLMEARNVGSVVVVDRLGYLTGIVTDRDIALRGSAHGLSADVEVSTIMTRDVATAGLRADAGSVAAIMRKRQVRRLPVTDDMGKVHGVVAMDDLLRMLRDETEVLTDTVVAQDFGIPT